MRSRPGLKSRKIFRLQHPSKNSHRLTGRQVYSRMHFASTYFTDGYVHRWLPVWALLICFYCGNANAQNQAEAEADENAQVDLLIEKVQEFGLPEGMTFRVRITKLDPPEPSEIHWRSGGEGLSGNRIAGELRTLPREKPQQPKLALGGKQPEKPAAGLDILDDLEGKKKPESDKPVNPTLFAIGQWSHPEPIGVLSHNKAPSKHFVTFTAGDSGKLTGGSLNGERQFENASKGLEMEFEFSFNGKVIKTFREEGLHGSTVGIVLPYYRLAGGKTPRDAEFLSELTGLSGYAKRRADFLTSLPSAAGPRPQRFAMITAFNGYGESHYFGIRYSSREVIEQEVRSLRALGINGFQGGPNFLIRQAMASEGLGAPFRRALETNSFGYPVPRADGNTAEPGAGCPFHPQVAERSAAGVKAAMEAALALEVDEIWGITVDEIGSVFDLSPEGKAHISTCPHCAAGFREFLAKEGLTPADFGSKDWSEISPAPIFEKGSEPVWLENRRDAMLGYWTRRFNCYASAQLFRPHREAFAAANETKKQLLAQNPSDAAAQRRPWIYTGAMRGNTFLMGGHSLDFFNFYREADTAFVYETSNRDARIWSWDSYLCDVGRTLKNEFGKEFGILVKPHRGAPIQRALAAVSRGATMINWYTYGPDYAKGDSFSQNLGTCELVAKANHLIAQAEDALYDCRWVHAPQVAVVKPRTSEVWRGLDPSPVGPAAWENAKWMYTMLQHAHLPVAAIDEGMLETASLEQYKAIYVSGTHLRRTAAARLANWVAAGGVLVTSGAGLVKDEYNQPLDNLQPVLGLQQRMPAEMWGVVSTYGATQLAAIKKLSSPGAKPAGLILSDAENSQPLAVGREVLQPGPSSTVLARFTDGAAAMVQNRFGKGQAYTLGFFPGVEYSAPLLTDSFDMGVDFSASLRQLATGPATDVAQPAVDASHPLVEGVLVEQPENKKRAVTLANWTYAVRGYREDESGRRSRMIRHVPLENVTVRIRNAGDVQKVTSCELGELPLERQGEWIQVQLPHLAEGDVLLLD